MARILVVGINYAPEDISTGKYTSELSEWLVLRGHAVRVITTPPYYPAWKVWPGFHRTSFSREWRNGVDLIRCPLFVPSTPTALTRLIHLASFALGSFLALLWSIAWRPNLVINIAPTLASAPGAWLFARLANARCWLHMQDFEVDAAVDMGIVKTSWIGGTLLAVERWVLRRYDRVSTISIRMLERLTKKGVLSQKSTLLPNWVDIHSIRPLEAVSSYRKELNIPTTAIVALYSGNMGQKQGLEILGEAAREMSKCPHVYFVFGGEGPGRVALEKQCEGLANVRFLSLQPTARLRDWLGLADIHLLPQRADVADLVMPSKLTGMLASGRPIVATAAPGTGLYEAISGCGLATCPGDSKAFVQALRNLANNPVMRNKLGRGARERAESTLNSDSILLRFEQQIICLLKPVRGDHR